MIQSNFRWVFPSDEFPVAYSGQVYAPVHLEGDSTMNKEIAAMINGC